MKNELSSGKIDFIGTVEKSSDDTSEIKLYERFHPALMGIESFSHLIVLYWFNLRDNAEHRSTLLVTPRRHKGAPEMGVFGTRSPSRPNPIGLCVVELLKVMVGIIKVKGLDADQGSPVVDIKPYLPAADSMPKARAPEWTKHGPKT